jgi:hypothetical protein
MWGVSIESTDLVLFYDFFSLTFILNETVARKRIVK